MPIAIKAKYQDKIMRDAEKMKKDKAKGDEATYKAMGGNVASYYAKGGKVAGCGSYKNKP